MRATMLMATAILHSSVWSPDGGAVGDRGDDGDFYGTEGVPTTWQEPLVMNSMG